MGYGWLELTLPKTLTLTLAPNPQNEIVEGQRGSPVVRTLAYHAADLGGSGFDPRARRRELLGVESLRLSDETLNLFYNLS